jgi:hypothetical protein
MVECNEVCWRCRYRVQFLLGNGLCVICNHETDDDDSGAIVPDKNVDIMVSEERKKDAQDKETS